MNLFAQFAGQTPEQSASMLLTHFKGVTREAEREAWRLWEKIAGGEPFNRPNADAYEAQHLMYTVRAIINKTEEPKVDRVDSFGGGRKMAA